MKIKLIYLPSSIILMETTNAEVGQVSHLSSGLKRSVSCWVIKWGVLHILHTPFGWVGVALSRYPVKIGNGTVF